MTDSEVVPNMEDYYDEDPWRFPFCDLFLYRYEKSNEKFEFKRKQARLWWPNNFYDASLASVNGTYLKKFGDFEMRVFSDSKNVLQRQMGMGWRYIGTVHKFNHYKLEERNKIKYLIPDKYTVIH